LAPDFGVFVRGAAARYELLPSRFSIAFNAPSSWVLLVTVESAGG